MPTFGAQGRRSVLEHRRLPAARRHRAEAAADGASTSDSPASTDCEAPLGVRRSRRFAPGAVGDGDAERRTSVRLAELGERELVVRGLEDAVVAGNPVLSRRSTDAARCDERRSRCQLRVALVHVAPAFWLDEQPRVRDAGHERSSHRNAERLHGAAGRCPRRTALTRRHRSRGRGRYGCVVERGVRR